MVGGRKVPLFDLHRRAKLDASWKGVACAEGARKERNPRHPTINASAKIRLVMDMLLLTGNALNVTTKGQTAGARVSTLVSK